MGGIWENCPLCDWMVWGGEDALKDDEYDDTNYTTKAKAKANLAKGLNIWGKPLPKVKPNTRNK